MPFYCMVFICSNSTDDTQNSFYMMAATKKNRTRGQVAGDSLKLAGVITVSKMFVCKYCDEVFPSEKERYAHQVDQHWKDLISQCEICVKSFLLKETPDPTHKCHLKSSDRGVQGSNGSESEKGEDSVVSKSTRKSARQTTRKIFTCKECDHVCRTILEMLNHKQGHHTPATQCHHCNLSCKNEQSLKEHLKLHTKQKWHFCSTCSEGFERESMLKDHRLSQHSEDDMIVQATTGEQGDSLTDAAQNRQDIAAQIEKNILQTKKYLCRYCMKRFAEHTTYREHVKNSHPKTFKCKICERSYVRLCELKLHMKHHCEERNFACTYCGKTFKRQPHLDCHILSHTGEKKYQCKECGKSFKAKRTLLGHEMTHSGSQPYECTDCGIKFTLKSSLLKHQASHANEGIRFPCPKCDKDFSSKVTLTIHDKAVHLKIKQYVCETCGAAFAYQSHLRKHQMVHRDERPFKCSHCERWFRLSYSRMLHERQHTGKKPFKCTLCNKEYATKARLERHQKVHQKEAAPIVHHMQQVRLYPVTIEEECNPHLTPELEKHYHHTAEAVVLEEQPNTSGIAACNICGIEFTTYNEYAAHQQTHSLTQLESHISGNQDVTRYHNQADTVSVMLSFMSSPN